MQESVCLFEYGSQLNVTCDGLRVEDFFEAVCLPHWKIRPFAPGNANLRLSNTSPEPGYPLKAEWNGENLLIAATTAELFRQLESFVHAYFAERSDNPIFVHCGAVEHNGECLLFPASTYSGKSTLIRALVDQGARYMSDEFALVNTTTRKVHAFPRRLHLRGNTPSVVKLPGPSHEAVVHGLPVKWIYFLKYTEGSHLSIAASTPAKAVLSLFENTIAAQRIGGSQIFPIFAHICSSAACFEGNRGEAQRAARAILESTKQPET